jgi:hypothetical protein
MQDVNNKLKHCRSRRINPVNDTQEALFFTPENEITLSYDISAVT